METVVLEPDVAPHDELSLRVFWDTSKALPIYECRGVVEGKIPELANKRFACSCGGDIVCAPVHPTTIMGGSTTYCVVCRGRFSDDRLMGKKP